MRTVGRLVIALVCVFSVGLETLPARAGMPRPQWDGGPYPVALEKHRPSYPVELWKHEDGQIVSLSLAIDSTGAVTSIEPIQGGGVFLELALDSARRWRYGPAIANGQAVRSYDRLFTWFNPERAVWSEEENRILDVEPQPLVPVPFPCPPGSELVLADRNNDLINVRVDVSGRVREVQFFRPAPPDSDSVRRTALRWIYRPLVSPDGPNAGRAIPFWATIRVDRSCSRHGQTELVRPDSLMLARLERTSRFRISKLTPSPQEQATLYGGSRSLPHAAQSLARARMTPGYQILSSDAVEFREVPADSIRLTIQAILTDERSYRARRRDETGAALEPGFVIKWNDYELVISPASDVMHIWGRSIMLKVPLGSRREELQRLLRAIFPS